MRAVQYAAAGAVPVVVDLPSPDCPRDGAVIAVAATGVCRSDWHAWRGHDPTPLPHVPGHEFAGVVTRVGAGVRRVRVGDRVTAPFVNGCGDCGWCRTGEAQVCPDQTQPGFTHPGSFAEEVVVRAADTNVVRLPDDVGMLAAAALGCRFATAYRALVTHARIAAGDTVAVFGCGGVGLSAIEISVASDARVIGIDLSPAALDRAQALGADEVVSEADPDRAVAAVRELTAGEGVHISVDALGSGAIARAAVRSLRRRGKHLQIGLMLGPDATTGLPWDLVVARELTVHGSHGMPAVDYPGMLDLVASGRLQPELLIGRTVDLDGAAAALTGMDNLVSNQAGTTMIVVDPDLCEK